MNISEANDVATLLRLLNGDLEHHQPDKVAEAADRLAVRVHKALYAGPQIEKELVAASACLLAGGHSRCACSGCASADKGGT